MNVFKKRVGKGEIKRKEWLRPVFVYKDDHITLKVLSKEKKSVTELINVTIPTYLPLSVYFTLTLTQPTLLKEEGLS